MFSKLAKKYTLELKMLTQETFAKKVLEISSVQARW